MKKLLFSLILIPILAACTPNLSELEKSDLLVQAQKMKYAIGFDGSEFFSLYEDYIAEGKTENEEGMRQILIEWGKKNIGEYPYAPTKLERDNLLMRWERVAKNLDFYDPNAMSEAADTMKSFKVNNYY